MDDLVHVEGAAVFTSLPGDSYVYRVDYEQSEGRAWLQSSKTEREWFVLSPLLAVACLSRSIIATSLT